MSTILLGAIQFKITVQDGQVIFEEQAGFYGCYARFAMERPFGLNDSPGTWQLVAMEDTFDRGVAMSRLIKAFEYCKDRFGGDFCPYKEPLNVSAKTS